jgi:salicylate hydroxylase
MERPDVWALWDDPPASTYYKGRAALLGDAAHTTTPNQGAGAGMAIEDAYILGALLGGSNSADEIEAAFDDLFGRRHATFPSKTKIFVVD